MLSSDLEQQMQKNERIPLRNPPHLVRRTLPALMDITRSGVVHIIDNDPTSQEHLASHFASSTLKICAYPTAEAFLATHVIAHPECLISEVRLPGMSGIDLLNHIVNRKLRLPAILVTTNCDLSLAVRAIKLGAFDFLQKPLNDESLILRVHEALTLDGRVSTESAQIRIARNRLAILTERELALLQLLIAGRSSKQAAMDLHISVKTVSNHRAHLLAKMEAANTADLIRMAMSAELPKRRASDE
jgi:two-component system, LuxR family, response regulator FixJ